MNDDEAIFDLLLTAAHRASIEVESELVGEHVSVMGLLVLRRAAEATVAKSPLTLNTIAAMLGSAHTSATEIVERLVRDGLVERVLNPSDRRSRVVELTALGEDVVREARVAARRCIASITRNFDREDKASLRLALERFDRGADWHRTERRLRLHAIHGPGGLKRPPRPHVR